MTLQLNQIPIQVENQESYIRYSAEIFVQLYVTLNFFLLSLYVPWNLSQRESGNGMVLFTIFSCLLFFPCLLCTILCICYFSISLDFRVEVLLVLLLFKETKTKMWITKFKTCYFRECSSVPIQFHSQFFNRVTCKESKTGHWVCNTIFIHFTWICRQHPASSRAELGLHCYWMTWLSVIERFLQAAPINAIRNVTY